MIRRALAGLALAAIPAAAFGQDAAALDPYAAGGDSGDTAWILTSSALVLLMTLPGLALFYGGLVRAKNLLSVALQCGAVAGDRFAAVDPGRLHHRVRPGHQWLARRLQCADAEQSRQCPRRL